MPIARRLTATFIAFTLCFIFFAGFAAASEPYTRDEVRALWHALCPEWSGSLFEEAPALGAPYAAGSLSGGLMQTALGRLNFCRKLAGLGEVTLSPALCDLSQHGAVLMAALGNVTHAPTQPADMDDAFFAQSQTAAQSCNLALFNWSSPSLLAEAVSLFARDDTAANLTSLGHRRWLLHPRMAQTGFGLALDEAGRSYVSMFVMDNTALNADYELICWPCAGAFPAEFMDAETPWSISPNPAVYDLEKSDPSILLEELVSGASWSFQGAGTLAGNGAFFIVSAGRYGDGPAYVFRPDLTSEAALEEGYAQNQIWRVTLTGMLSRDAQPLEPIEYTACMMSLTPIDPASVELSVREITLRVGEEASVSALVYPRWADELSYTLSVNDERIASITPEGMLTARAQGECTLTAATVNGRTDSITVKVTQ